jgi:hypothetical protein
MELTEILKRLDDLGLTVTVRGDWLRVHPGSNLPVELMAELKAHKDELMAMLDGQRENSSVVPVTGAPQTEAEIIAEAHAIADKGNDALGIRDERAREVNRLTRALMDLQDAGFPDKMWLPLQQRCREIEQGLSCAPKHAQTEVISPENVWPLIPCFACGGTDFWQRPDGGTVCSTCHPQPGGVASNKRQ